MDTAACLPIAADRAGPCVRTIFFEGLDLTGVTLALEMRIIPEAPGLPLVALGMTGAPNAEGIRLVGVTRTAGVPTSQIALRVSKATMKDKTKVPYVGDFGTSAVLVYDLIGIFGQDERRLCYGTFTALPTVYDMDAAPTDRPMGGSSSAVASTWTSARLTFTDNAVTVKIDGGDLTAAHVTAAQVAAGQSAQERAAAGAEADRAQAAADVAGSAATRFFDTKAALVAAALPNGTVARVWTDESNKGRYTEYRIEAGGPVLKLDIPRINDAASFGSQGFLVSSFRGDNELSFVDLSYSPDGKNVYRLNSSPVYAPGEIRDPSIILADDGWWHMLGSLGYNSTAIVHAKAKSPAGPWQTLPEIECGAVAWAPSFFRHPITGRIFGELALADNPERTVHHMAYIEFTSPDLSTNNPPVSFGIAGNYIDAQTFYDPATGTFSQFSKKEDDGAKYIERFTSTTYPNPGGWTKSDAGDYIGFKAAAVALGGDSVEGPTGGWLNGLFYLMVDANSIQKVFMATAPSPAGPWAAPVLVDTHNSTLRHFFTVPLTDANTRAATVEAIATLLTQRVAEMAPASRAAVVLDAYLQPHWSKGLQFAGDRMSTVGRAQLLGEVSRDAAPTSDADRAIAFLPPAFANATIQRFHCVTIGNPAGADLIMYKGVLIWERGGHQGIDLGSISYILDGAVTGLLGG